MLVIVRSVDSLIDFFQPPFSRFQTKNNSLKYAAKIRGSSCVRKPIDFGMDCSCWSDAHSSSFLSKLFRSLMTGHFIVFVTLLVGQWSISQCHAIVERYS